MARRMKREHWEAVASDDSAVLWSGVERKRGTADLLSNRRGRASSRPQLASMTLHYSIVVGLINEYLVEDPVLSRPVRRSEVMPDVAPPDTSMYVRQHQSSPSTTPAHRGTTELLGPQGSLTRRGRPRLTASMGNQSEPPMIAAVSLVDVDWTAILG